jgi:N-dimethylarginine dimethylaminohydrolase
MCRPTYFDVTYRINPWMHPGAPVDTARAVAQWETLVATYRRLGHTVSLVEPVAGQPDMVFAANGGLVVDGKAVAARFRNAQRTGEQEPYARALAGLGLPDPLRPTLINEGEGDFLLAGGQLLMGTGFRSDPLAALEVQEHFGRPVVTLQLTDPRFYHLDTALAVLAERRICYLPQAFSPGSRAVLERLFPGALHAAEADAVVLGLNAVSDGNNVVVAAQATGLHAQLRDRGFTVVPVDVSELLLAGGGIKCCTLEVRPAGLELAATG